MARDQWCGFMSKGMSQHPGPKWAFGTRQLDGGTCLAIKIFTLWWEERIKKYQKSPGSHTLPETNSHRTNKKWIAWEPIVSIFLLEKGSHFYGLTCCYFSGDWIPKVLNQIWSTKVLFHQFSTNIHPVGLGRKEFVSWFLAKVVAFVLFPLSFCLLTRVPRRIIQNYINTLGVLLDHQFNGPLETTFFLGRDKFISSTIPG